MRLNNQSQRRRGNKQWKTSNIVGFICSKKLEKSSNGPPLWIIFKEKIRIAHLLPERSARQDDHFLQTLPLLSIALDKFFSHLKIAFLKMGRLSKFKVIGPEEIPILVWGRRKRPLTKMGST